MTDPALRKVLRLFHTPQPTSAAEYPSHLLRGARTATRRFRRGHVRYYTWGQGPTILLMHGWSSRAARMGSLVRPLVKRGFRVLALDAPGHGESSGRISGLPRFQAAVRAAWKRWGPFHAAVGHSLGGTALALLSAWQPELAPRRLAIVASPGNLVFLIEAFARAAQLPPEVAGAMLAWLEQRHGRPVSEWTLPLHGPRLPRHGLIVHDHDDAAIPVDHSLRLHEAWPGARLLLTRGLGHSMVMHDPEVVKELVDFLAGDAPPEV